MESLCNCHFTAIVLSSLLPCWVFLGRILQLQHLATPLRDALESARFPTSIWIAGQVVSPPRAPSEDNVILVLSVDRFRLTEDADWIPLARPERVRLNLRTHWALKDKAPARQIISDLQSIDTFGDRLTVKARHWPAGFTFDRNLEQPPSEGIPFDKNRWLAAEGWSASLSAFTSGLLEYETDAGPQPLQAAMNIRGHLADTYDRLLPTPAAALAKGMILGDRDALERVEWRGATAAELFRLAGLSHLLAVSGLHTGMVGAALWALLKPLKLPKPLGGNLVLLCLLLFWMMTGMRPATTRAVLMLGIGIICRCHFNHSIRLSALEALFLSLYLMLLHNPMAWGGVGFQLSYLAVLSLLLIAPKLLPLLRPLRLPASLKKALAAQGAIQLGMMIPATCGYFGTYSLAGLLLNLLAIPLAGLVVPATLALGLAGALIPIDLVWTFPADLSAHSLQSFFELSHLACHLLPATELPRLGTPGILIYLVSVYGMFTAGSFVTNPLRVQYHTFFRSARKSFS